MIVFYFFFFFQAEDGIRDYKVTGVQTCALPISSAGKCAAQSGLSDRHTPSQSASNRGSMGVSMMPSSRRQIMRIALPYIRLAATMGDRKSTRLNSSHLVISYAVFCLKKNNEGM